MSVKKNTRQGGFFASAKKDTHQRASLSSVFLFTLGKEASLTSVLLALRKELFLPSARKKKYSANHLTLGKESYFGSDVMENFEKN